MADEARRRRAAIFGEIHKDLPREGPGDAPSTRRAYRLVTGLPPNERILDVGCGPGAHTIDLASCSRSSSIVAFDVHQPYLDQLVTHARAADVSHRVRLVRASMADMPFAAGSFDMVWAEGSIYILGFEAGLRQWRRLLRPSGHLVVTHLSWLSSDIPNEPRAFWNRHYPAIRTVDENAEVSTRCGYDLVERFALPASAWWTDYYSPMEMRLAALKDEHRDDDEALAVIESSHEQIALYRRFAHCYGYVFYILRALPQ